MKRYERLTKNFIGNRFSLSVTERQLTHSYVTHWHEFYEMELILSGKGIYTINGEPHPLCAGEVFFLTPADFHSVTIDSQDPPCLINVMFDGSLVEPELMFDFLRRGRNIAKLPTDSFEEVRFLCRLLRKECSRADSAALRCMEGLLCSILTIVMRNLSDSRSLPAVGEASQRAAFYIQSHFREPITLKDVSEYVGLSAPYLSELFHKQMGITLKAYLIEARLAYAAKMLTFSDLSITEICYAGGFGDFSAFSRIFKRRFQKTPGAYRAECRRAAGSDPEAFFRTVTGSEAGILVREEE